MITSHQAPYAALPANVLDSTGDDIKVDEKLQKLVDIESMPIKCHWVHQGILNE